MKKIALIISAVALVATISSCKKNYTCECCSSCTGLGTTCESTTSGKMKKKDAQAWCDEGEESHTSGGITCSTSCELK